MMKKLSRPAIRGPQDDLCNGTDQVILRISA